MFVLARSGSALHGDGFAAPGVQGVDRVQNRSRNISTSQARTGWTPARQPAKDLGTSTEQRPMGTRLSERHTALPAVCRSSRRDAAVDQAQDMWSNDTVTVPLAFRVAWALSWNCRCEPSEPVALTLKVECSTPLRRLFSSPNQLTKCPV